MASGLKSFFQERSIGEFKELNIKEVYRQKGLVERILSLDEKKQGLVIKVELLPRSFAPQVTTQAELSRKYLKHGPYIISSQPQTIEIALASNESPLDIRRRDFAEIRHFNRKKRRLNEDEVRVIGYSFRPIQGPDKLKRLVPFARILDGARLFAYAAQKAGGIQVKEYEKAECAATEGVVAIAEVPSKRAKISRYTLAVRGIPVHDNAYQRAIAWGFRTSGERIPDARIYSFGFKLQSDNEQSNNIIFDDKDVAAGYAIAAHYMVAHHNRVPWDMIPLAKPSAFAARFDTLVRNNVLVHDATLENEDKRRHLHLAERSLLIGRLIALKSHDATMFWQAGRDPKLTEYAWD